MEEGHTGIAWVTDNTVARTNATKLLLKRILEVLIFELRDVDRSCW